MNIQKNSNKITVYLFTFLILYFLFESLWFSYLSMGAGLDDAELISNTSFWNWGYGGSQPPLYTWIGYGVTSIFGLNFTVLQILRFSILCSTFFAVYIGLRQLKVNRLVSAFACLSVFLLPQISWESQRALIHSILGTAGAAWSFAAFVWFVNRPNYKRAIIFGLAIAVAILGKYSGVIFIAALFLSALFLSQVRSALNTRYNIVSIIAAIAFMSPALIFMLQNPSGVLDRTSKFKVDVNSNWLLERFQGLLDLISASIGFVGIVLGVSIIIAIIAYLKQRKNKLAFSQNARSSISSEVNYNAHSEVRIDNEDLKNAARFLQAILISGLLIWTLVVIFSGATNVKDRWLQSTLLLAAPYATLLLARFDLSGQAARAIGVLGLVVACLVPVFLYGNLYLRQNKDDLPVQSLDYAYLADNLNKNGAIKTILAPVPFYAGNIRLLDPQIKTLFAETPKAMQRLKRPLVVLWGGQGSTMNNKKLDHKLLTLLQKAGLDKDSLSEVKMLHVPYRYVEAGKDHTELFFYLYIP